MKSALIIDDHPMIHVGCAQMLRDIGFDEVHLAASAAEGISQARRHDPAIAILDLGLPDRDGLETIPPLLDALPTLRLLVFSMNDRPVLASRALAAGAHGFLSKNAPPPSFREAVQTILGGGIHLDHDIAMKLVAQRPGGETDPLGKLTARERDVLFCLGDGLDLAAIADRLQVSYKTAANVSSSIKRKLGARGLNDLIRIAIENRTRNR